MRLALKNKKWQLKMDKFKNEIKKVQIGHLKSDRAVDRHFFLNGKLDDSLLQIIALTENEDSFKNVTISRLMNLFIMEGILNLNNMGVKDAFQHILDLNDEFESL